MSNDCQKQHNTRFTVNLKRGWTKGSQIIFDQQPVSSCNLLFSSLSFKGKSSLRTMLVIHYRLEKSESTKKLSSSYTYTFCVGYVLVSLDKYYAFFLD